MFLDKAEIKAFIQQFEIISCKFIVTEVYHSPESVNLALGNAVKFSFSILIASMFD